MNDREKARALSRSLDAMVGGDEASSVAGDQEVQALSDLGRSLHDVEFEPSPIHRAAVERLLQKHRAQIRQVISAPQENGMRSPATQEPPEREKRSLPGWFAPVTAFSGVALLFACVLVIAIGGGVAWWALRDKDVEEVVSSLHRPTSTVEAVIPPLITANPQVEQAVSPTVTPTSQVEGQGETPSAETPGTGTPSIVFLPSVSLSLPPQSAKLLGVRGVVEIQMGEDDWAAASDGQIVQAGQRVRTSALSSAQIAFSDGSVAYLGASTDISVDNLDAHAEDRARIVELTQWAGETDHDVVSAVSKNARYVVHTPSGTGEAKGTLFHVLVTPSLVAHFSVDEGAVAVTHLEVTVIVVAGQLTTIEVGQVPSEPFFRITGEGQVTEVGMTWRIAGQTFSIHDDTVIIGNPQAGDWVTIDGHLLEDGSRVADRILLLRRSPTNRFTVTGEVEAMEVMTWTVAGLSIAVNDETDVDDDIETGDVVRVEGMIEEDGTLLAERIRLIKVEPGAPFYFSGVVQEIEDTYWVISGISVTLDANTTVDDDVELGDLVEVHGWVLDLDGETWLARSIEQLAEQEPEFEFIGYVEEIDPWLVSGIAFETEIWTEIEEGIEIDDLVVVEGWIAADGTWIAQEIKLAQDEELSFEFVGVVDEIDPWVVSGISLTVTGDTEIQGQIAVGDLVAVEGTITPEGEWLATEIKPVSEVRLGSGCVMITAIVLGVHPGSISVMGNVDIELEDDILVEGELASGSVVQMWVCVDNDGHVYIVSIVVIYQLDPIVIIAPPVIPPSTGEGTVTICHKPGTKAEKTKNVPRSALSGHLGHGDTIGSCP